MKNNNPEMKFNYSLASDMLNKGNSVNSISITLNIPRTTLRRYLSKNSTKPKSTQGPRILFFDIETAPDIAAVFSRFKTNISNDAVVTQGGWLISASWCTNLDHTVKSIRVTPGQAVNQDDYWVLKSLMQEIEKSDIIVAHNACGFDVPMLRARMTYWDLSLKRNVKIVDTLKIVKAARFRSNKLDSLCSHLLGKNKTETGGIKLWIQCLDGNLEALNLMQKYNEKDVELLFELYQKIKGLDKNPPMLNLYYNDDLERCPNCGSTDVHPSGSLTTLNTTQYESMHCNTCGANPRRKQILNSKEKRATLLLPTK